MSADYFFRLAIPCAGRALSLLDRNSYSKTFGCFDKYYWHFKLKDFPSSSYQMGVEFLARLWNLPVKDNVFYKNPQLLAWIQAGMAYTCSIQNKDGSFDEWYPNERGWAGPGSYVIHSLVNAYKITKSELEESLKKQILDCCLKSSHFLRKQKEGAQLANHYALFLLSLYEIYKILPDSLSPADFESYFTRFKSFVSEEGWSMEYDNVDFGYNLATLSFLARLHKIYPHSFLEEYAKKSFDFLSFFCYPDGSFGGLGSRETIHLYPYALKYWGLKAPLARSLDYHLRDKKAYERLTPADQDDHYLFYRLSEYLEADELDLSHQSADQQKPAEGGQRALMDELELSHQSADQQKPVEEGQRALMDELELSHQSADQRAESRPALPFQFEANFNRYFPSSGFFVRKSDDFYFVANLKKGACLRVYSLKTNQCLLKNNGWVLKSKNSFFSNNWRSENHKISLPGLKPFFPAPDRRGGEIAGGERKFIGNPASSGPGEEMMENERKSYWESGSRQEEEEEISVSGKSAVLSQKYFSAPKLIVFRLLSALAINSKIAFLFKKAIRRLLIAQKRKPKYDFKRSIFFKKNEVHILDYIKFKTAEKLFYGGAFTIRYVPQSNYFEAEDLQSGASSHVFNLKGKKGEVLIKQVCRLKNTETRRDGASSFEIKVDLI